MTTYIYHCNVAQSTFTSHENVCALYIPLCKLLTTTHLFTVSRVFCLLQNGIQLESFSFSLKWEVQTVYETTPGPPRRGPDRLWGQAPPPRAAAFLPALGLPSSHVEVQGTRVGFLLTGRPPVLCSSSEWTQVPVGCVINRRAISSGPLLWAHPMYPFLNWAFRPQ